MNKNTFESYKEAVLAKYDEVKHGELIGFLANPTPALIRDLCILLAQGKMDSIDDSIFNLFFNFKNEAGTKESQIEAFDTDRFRPLKTFLLKKTDLTKTKSVDLVAVLVGYENRPYRKFLKIEEKPSLKKEELKQEEKISEKFTDIKSFSGNFKKTKNNPSLKNSLWIIGFVLILSGLVYSFFPVKNCMEWKNDHYELIDCEDQAHNLLQTRIIIPKNQELLERMKKIMPSETTSYFSENGQPLIWYSKKDNKYEFFSYHGLHPENRNITLRQITRTIILSYEKSEQARNQTKREEF